MLGVGGARRGVRRFTNMFEAHFLREHPMTPHMPPLFAHTQNVGGSHSLIVREKSERGTCDQQREEQDQCLDGEWVRVSERVSGCE